MIYVFNETDGSSIKGVCLDCKERKKYLDKNIYNCHTYCKKYKGYKEKQEEVRKARRKEAEANSAEDYSYTRVTRNKHQKY